MDAASATRARILLWAAIALIVGSAALSGPSDTASDLLGLLAGLIVLAIAWVYWEARSVAGASDGHVSILWPVLLTLIGLVIVATNLVRLL
jgi:hypothetical protein